MHIGQIQEAVRRKTIRISGHAVEEAEFDDLTLEEILESALAGEVIEDYPNDRPYPSCLVCCVRSDDAIHSVWAYNEENGWAVLVTVYRADPGRWIDWRERKK